MAGDTLLKPVPTGAIPPPPAGPLKPPIPTLPTPSSPGSSSSSSSSSSPKIFFLAMGKSRQQHAASAARAATPPTLAPTAMGMMLSSPDEAAAAAVAQVTDRVPVGQVDSHLKAPTEVKVAEVRVTSPRPKAKCRKSSRLLTI